MRIPRPAFDAQATPGSGLLVGSTQEIIDKLLTYHQLYGVTRAIIQMGFGGIPQQRHLEAIERLGAEVAPVVCREVEQQTGRAADLLIAATPTTEARTPDCSSTSSISSTSTHSRTNSSC